MMTTDRTTPATYTPPDGPIHPLTERQEQVVALAVRGFGHTRIAKAMGISRSTVKGHVDRIDNLFAWPRDPGVSALKRIRFWGTIRQHERDLARRRLG